MVAYALFWTFFSCILLSWELVLVYPAQIFYLIFLCILASTALSWFLVKDEEKTKSSILNQISFIFLCLGIFFWLLWLDFIFVKFAVPFVLWIAIFYIIRGSDKTGIMRKITKLGIFLGGTFFWSSISYGLLTVLGWQLWQVFLIFLFSFIFISWPAVKTLEPDSLNYIKAWILLVLLGAELFAVIAWLPFTELTLALILTLFVMFVYDLEKYFIDPLLIRRRIIIKKALIYLIFLCLVLISTPWS